MSPRLVGPRRLGNSHRAAIAALALISGLYGVPRASADPQPSAPPLPKIQSGEGYAESTIGGGKRMLAEFLLTAKEGDHHIERIAARSTSISGTFVAFHNKKQDNCEWTEPSSGFEAVCKTSNTNYFQYNYRVGTYELPTTYADPSKHKSIAKDVACEGACTTSLENPPAGFHFVLSGFSVSYDDGNKFVRRLSVLPYSSSGKLTMRFHDNGKPKFHGSMKGLFLPAAMFKEAKKEATLEYTPGKPAPKLNLGYDAFAIVGFDFEFLNGDHKLKTIGFKYERPYLIPKLSDQNTDDPWRVKIQYAVLKL